MAAPADASTGGLSPESVGQSGGKRSAWIAHIKSVAKAKGIKFGEAMKIASKTFKGGQLVGKGVPMGGKRRGTKKNGRKGGALYGFGAGDGNASADGGLADGAAAYGTSGDATYRGSTELTGAPAGAAPAAPAAGGRRRSRRHRRRSSKTAKVGGKRRR